MRRNFLVTGGAGFIGSNITARLLEEGHCVRVLDNFSTGRRENIEGLPCTGSRGTGRFELIEGDIRDLEVVKKAMKDVDYCLHQAALSSVERSIREPIPTTETNIRGTLNVFIAAKETKIKRVVFSSSSSIYGGGSLGEAIPLGEPNPLSPYAVTKLVGEHYGRLFFRLHGLDVITLRYFNVFGPHQDPESEYAAVIPRFIRAALKNEQPFIYGDGEQSRDFTYVDNVVEANMLAVNTKNKAGGENFNIATSSSITVNKLWGLISGQIQKNIKPVFMPPRKGDVKHSLADISKAKEKLGYSVKVDFETGLAKTIEYFKL